MVFHSLQFLLFVPTVFALYWLCAGVPFLRKAVLLVASAIFYCAFDPHFYLLVVYLVTFDFFAAWGMANVAGAGKRKVLLWASVINNLFVLCFFKYINFFLDSLVAACGWISSDTATEALSAAGTFGSWFGLNLVEGRYDIVLPIGLSFVVFQTLSYTIDVYRGDCEARRAWTDVMLFISFFPQVIAGPIKRASWFLPQLDRRPELSSDAGAIALLRIAKGLGKKLLIADYLAANIIDRIFSSPEHYTAPEVWTAVLAYTLQIYYDFSAYSDIAIGVSALFGFVLEENFDRPYKSTDLTDFWRRWHISLSTWLRDYLYVPLGGNRGGKLATLRNVMITMVLGGIWHGASWRMALWGFVHGLGLCMTRILIWTRGMPPKNRPWWRLLPGWTATFLSVMLARIFFRAENMELAYRIFDVMFHPTSWQAPNVTPPILGVLGLSFLIHLGPSNLFSRIAAIYVRLPIVVRALALVAIGLVIKRVASFDVQPFIYTQF